MKFFMKFIVPLLSGTTVFGSILGTTLSADGLFQSISNYEASQECINELTGIKNCLINNITKENLSESCSYYSSETCKIFFDNPFGTLSSCKDNSVVSAIIISSVKLIDSNLKVKCQNDENGNICPLAEVELNNPQASNEQILQSIKDSCKSKICKENTLSFIENASEMNNKASNILQSSLSKISSQFSNENLNLDSVIQDQTNNNNEISSYLEILKSDSCKTQANATSGVIPSIKYISSLIYSFIFAILFYIIY